MTPTCERGHALGLPAVTVDVLGQDGKQITICLRCWVADGEGEKIEPSRKEKPSARIMATTRGLAQRFLGELE